MKNSWSYHLYRASLASFIILVTAVLLGALYDIGQQQVTRTVLSAGKSTRAADILITGGAFILTVRLCYVVVMILSYPGGWNRLLLLASSLYRG